MEAFQDLGQQVEREWRRRNYREAALPEIAHAALATHAMHERVSWRDLVHWCVRTPLLDTDNRVFGDVPLRVYESPRFYVEALIWNDGQLAIHDHAFSGAFSVLGGASLHMTYAFRAAEMLNEGFGVGELTLQAAEPLRVGDVRTIEAGRGFVHAVYHMDAPTVSLVIRSRVDTRALPQLAYLHPGVAFDRSTVVRDAIDKPLAALRIVANVDRELYLSLARDAITERDAHLAFEVVSRAARGPLLDAPDAVAELSALAAATHPALAPVLPRAVATQLRSADLLTRRNKAKAAEVRLLFALLLNVPRRAELLAIAGQHTGEDPIETVLHWLRLASASRLLPAELGTRQLAFVRDHLAGRSEPGAASVLDAHSRRVLEPLLAA